MTARSRLAVILVAAASTIAAAAAQNALTQAGVNEPSARAAVLQSLSGGYVDYGLATKAVKALTGAARAQLVSGLVAWARAYTASPTFLKAYTAQRQEAKPEAPTFTGTPDEELTREMAREKADQEKNAEEMKKVMASMPAETRKAMEEGLKAAASAMAQMNTPEMRKMRVDGIRMQREAATTAYREDLKRWEAQYPENPAPVIRRQLQAFMDLSGTVDFNAQLEKKDGHMVFVNPAYERKDGNWKLCFRAGRETVEAARTAVQAWLAELR